jgi:hypothetical protein
MIRDELAQRIYFDEPVALQPDGAALPLEGRAHNLSHSGIFVGSVEPLALESRVSLSFELPDGSLFSSMAQVVRTVTVASAVEPVGMALRFEDVDELCTERLNAFLAARLQPAAGERVRLNIGDVDVPIATRAQSSFGHILSVDAELPFLTLGSQVTLSGEDEAIDGTGAIRWVSVHVCPETGVPRLNIGIERNDLGADGALVDEEEFDPICTDDFAEHAQQLDKEIRAERKSGKHPKQKRAAIGEEQAAASS